MAIDFPSQEFDEAVAAVCHGTLTEEQARSLNTVLRGHPAAQDEYLMRIELHSRLASNPDLFAVTAGQPWVDHVDQIQRSWKHKLVWVLAAAASIAILATLALRQPERPEPPRSAASKPGATSTAVAMLGPVVDAEWNEDNRRFHQGEPLDPGFLRLDSGLIQIVLYSGTRIVVQGPAEVELVSQNELACRRGRVTADVPPQAKGFYVRTPQVAVTDLGTSFGLFVEERSTELHVFKGSVELESVDQSVRFREELDAGSGTKITHRGIPLAMAIDRNAFASHFDLEAKSVAVEEQRFDEWRKASERKKQDESLILRLDFEGGDARSDWTVPNVGHPGVAIPDATIVGCQRTSGRWPGKSALEFKGVSDRVRLSVPGEYDELTLMAWVRVQGLDRKINSLFMSDGFERGTLHWLVREDGVLGLTVVGQRPRDYQILATRPVVTLDRFGSWMHLAVVVDGRAERVVHYLDGQPVERNSLRIRPPYRIGTAELGNWNAKGFGSPVEDPSLVRNFSGAFDEFFLFNRALDPAEIRAHYTNGNPQRDPGLPTHSDTQN